MANRLASIVKENNSKDNSLRDHITVLYFTTQNYTNEWWTELKTFLFALW